MKRVYVAVFAVVVVCFVFAMLAERNIKERFIKSANPAVRIFDNRNNGTSTEMIYSPPLKNLMKNVAIPEKTEEINKRFDIAYTNITVYNGFMATFVISNGTTKNQHLVIKGPKTDTYSRYAGAHTMYISRNVPKPNIPFWHKPFKLW